MGVYGLPYQGSKSAIAEKLLSFIPKADTFYDLFGGGGAISHYAITTKKWNTVVYNEINHVVVKGFFKAIRGDYENEKRWISREEFHESKNIDPYAKLCFSFGNDGRSYCYGKHIEEYKKAMHDAIMNGNYEPYKIITGLDIEPYLKELRGHDARIKMKQVVAEFENTIKSKLDGNNSYRTLSSLEHIERVEKVNSLKSLQTLSYVDMLHEDVNNTTLPTLKIYNGDYRNVKIEGNAVIYCDIPYLHTKKYDIDFNYDVFWNWVSWQTVPVYVSSYNIDRTDFKEVANISKNELMSIGNNAKRIEKLYRYIGGIHATF